MLTQQQRKTLEEASLRVYLIFKEINKQDDKASNAFSELLLSAVNAIDNIRIMDDALPF